MNLKKILPLLPLLLMTGCSTTFTRLTPLDQPRNPNNLYPVEVQFNTTQQSIRPESVKPYVLVNGDLFPLRQVPLVPDRWEGFVQVPPDADSVTFRFKFDYLENAFGSQPKPASAESPLYQLKVTGQ